MIFGGAVRSELNDAACAEMLKCYRDGGCDAYWRDGEPGTDNNIYKQTKAQNSIHIKA